MPKRSQTDYAAFGPEDVIIAEPPIRLENRQAPQAGREKRMLK